ncbi:LysR family transcriptional regulator [Arhodomonas sp. AD133]|uniref:LysR family transcriptional regulator n=1 Tax=Arhodomonas sp. AD133 TaxID=3415009 RepID=UPI003EB7A2BC
MLTLRQLETFVQIVELGTFERAAQRLNATQSTISKRVAELEEATGLTLFDRSRRSARLTEDGERLLELAIDTLSSANRIMQLNHEPDQTLHRVRVGFTELTALTWLPGFLQDYTRERPEVRLDITIDMSRTLYQMFQDGDLDLIVIPLVPEAHDQPRVETRLVSHVEMAFMARSGLVQAPSPLPVDHLNRYTLLGQGKQSGFAQTINRWMYNQGVQLPPTLLVDNLLALVGLITAGRGISVLPRHCVQGLARDADLVEIDTSPRLPDVAYYTMYRDEYRAKLLDDFATNLIEAADFTRPFFV